MRRAWLIGCLWLAPPPPAPAAPADDPITFTRNVAPLVHRRCAACHHPGASGPFALLTYRDVRKRAGQILDVVEQRLMPPWRPEPGYGAFRDSRRLDDAELELLRRWVQAGAPEGEAAATPAAPRFVDDWQLGPPDLVVTMPKPYRVRAEGRDVFRNFVLPLGLTTERWLAAVELRPGNLRLVHHAFVTVDAQRRGRKADEADKGLGFGGLDFGAGDGVAQVWAPGAQAHRFVAGTGLRVPAGSDLVLQTHLRPTGAAETLQASIGLYFHERPPGRGVATLPFAIRPLRIPAGDAAYEVRRTVTLPFALEALAIFPHLHALGREVQVTAHPPQGPPIPMVWIRQWSFAWQDLYQYETPVHLPRGTRVELRFVFDNSAANPENPHVPPRAVHWGAQVGDEMALVLLQVIEPPELRRELRRFGRPLGE